MTDVLLFSTIVLWVVVLALTLVVFALARQVGLLHERIAPAGALQPTGGPAVGEPTDAMQLPSIDGAEVKVGGPDSRGLATLVFFVSPTCRVCRTLIPTMKSVARREARRLRLVFASDGEPLDRHVDYRAELGLAAYPYVLSESLGLAYQVSRLPFAVLIAADGRLASKGLVNTREHIESLLEAMDTGVATLQDYMRGQESAVGVATHALERRLP